LYQARSFSNISNALGKIPMPGKSVTADIIVEKSKSNERVKSKNSQALFADSSVSEDSHELSESVDGVEDAGLTICKEEEPKQNEEVDFNYTAQNVDTN